MKITFYGQPSVIYPDGHHNTSWIVIKIFKIYNGASTRSTLVLEKLHTLKGNY